jgi:hypothetical protein
VYVSRKPSSQHAGRNVRKLHKDALARGVFGPPRAARDVPGAQVAHNPKQHGGEGVQCSLAYSSTNRGDGMKSNRRGTAEVGAGCREGGETVLGQRA